MRDAEPRIRGQRPSLPMLVVLLAGLWLLASPAILGCGQRSAPCRSTLIAGMLLAVVATYQLATRGSRRASALAVSMGPLFSFAPITLQYGYVEPTVEAIVNYLATGVVLVVAGALAARARTGPEREGWSGTWPTRQVTTESRLPRRTIRR